MPHESAVCPVCTESHLTLSPGRMSIHDNRDGERCEGSAPVQPAQRRQASQRPEAPDNRTDARRRRDEREARTRANFRIERPVPYEEAIKLSAWDFAALERKGLIIQPRSQSRTQYVADKYEVVRGGLPTHGRRR